MLLSTLGAIMEQVNFNYSIKNIPIPSQQDFRIQMIKSVEHFVKNIRWRAFHYLNPVQTNVKKETFGFTSTKPAPYLTELKELENHLYDLTNNITFKKYNNSFRTELRNDAINVENETKLIIAADKTRNFYKLEKEDHDELLEKHITKDYKKSNDKAFEDTTKKDKEIATKLELDDRIYKTSKKQAFITLKDHKQSFQNNPTCRLINPTKPELGKVSKQKLAQIVNIVKQKN